MLNTPDPWSGLEAGALDSRRVDSSGRWDFFWSVTVDGYPALVLRVKELPLNRPELPRLKALDLRFLGSDRPVLVLTLKDRSQTALFLTLCEDIILATQAASDESRAASLFVARTARWHHLLRGGGAGLSEERQKGLIGELRMLQVLCRATDASSALAAWGGPFGSQKDFDDGRFCVEVKSVRSSGKPKVRIASEHQLADVPDRSVVLAVLAVDRVAASEGMDLHGHVACTAELLRIAENNSDVAWELALSASGYREDDETLCTSIWKAGPFQFFDVIEGFPRLLPPLPDGVSDLGYAIDLAACQAFLRDCPVRPAEMERLSK